MRTVPLKSLLQQMVTTERIARPEIEQFVTVKLNCGGAIPRVVKDGKTPVPFTGYRIQSGQFIYSRIDARNGAFAIVPDSLHGAVVSKDFPVFEINSDLIEANYLVHLIRSGRLERQIHSLSFGATNRQRIGEDVFLALQIPLPSLDEQHRIAAILDKADALRAKRRAQLEALNALPQAIFQEMFGYEPREHVLGNCLVGIETGTSLPCEAREANKDEWGILKLSAVTHGAFRPCENKAFMGEPSQINRSEVHVGDVLMTRKNTPELVGHVAYVDQPVSRLALPDLVFRIHLNERLNPRYFQTMMMSPATREAVRRLAGGAASSMSNISGARLRTLQIPVPAMEKQNEFAELVQAIQRHRSSLAASLDEADALFVSLQSRAFRGEL